MKPDETNMELLKLKVDRLEVAVEENLQAQKETNSNLSELSKGVSELVIQLKVRDEADKRQEEKNDNLTKRLETVESDNSEIRLEMARNSQSTNFLNKYWPVLFAISIIALGYMSGIGKSIIQ